MWRRYADGSECVGLHADEISELGPRPVIVGLSLGAARPFDLKEEGSGSRHAKVHLPHNSAAVMWQDAQETWVHGVPRCSDSRIVQHKQTGLARFSLTFRMKRSLPDLGICNCGKPAGLKAKQGRYYLHCTKHANATDQSSLQHCAFWKPCAWAEEEAARLRLHERLSVL